ncbi:ATP-dependent DNA ligase [Fistulina hepatica ATCC 64428]|uniref:DNA ligase n=1 Tax=Fistulina hepatica ATCC 64428 TaxID=1128425 RepID=A0A0D7AAH2_9AGAR|nr:ATP-dependent DNA ligase [Fistulina hepatica ATCC 64428]
MMQPTPAPTSPPDSPYPTDVKMDVEQTTDYPSQPMNFGSDVPFDILEKFFDALQKQRKSKLRQALIRRWFYGWRKERGPDLYPALRLILPQRDRERPVYGLKEKALARLYIKMMGLPVADGDAKHLLQWKKPSDRSQTSGDFPTVLYDVVSKRSSVIKGSLSIEQVNELLDDLARSSGKRQRIYNEATPNQQRWIVRIILKDMNISVKETSVFKEFHPDAQDLYNTCSDLKQVAWQLSDPETRLRPDDKAVRLFSAFAPMLCKRPTRKIDEVVAGFGQTSFIIEEKLDGERMQLHKRGKKYFYCSRKGKDYTYLYGAHPGEGSLTPYIDKEFDPRVEEIILDGEMLVWDPVSESNLPFGTLKTAALDKSKAEYNPRPCFKVFDLLYLNGQSLLERPTSLRKKNLRSCFKEVSGRLEFALATEGRTTQDVREQLDKILENHGEGLVLKHPKAKYVLAGRNSDWVKVKPEYMDNLGETVDVLVVAGNHGKRKGGGVTALICAVLDDRRPDDEDDDEKKYSSFVRIGTGLSYADYVWVRARKWKPWDPQNPPAFLQTAKKSTEDKGDVYLEPKDSFIVRVKASEIMSSGEFAPDHHQYHMRYTMRFPRALAIRDDLAVEDCMTATALMQHVQAFKKRKLDDKNDVVGGRKKKRKAVAKAPSMLASYASVDVNDVPLASDLFDGMKFGKFLVIADPKSRTGAQDRTDLMKKIISNKGTSLQVAKDPAVLVVYGGSTTPLNVRTIIRKNVHDIIKPAWIIDCIEQKQLLPLHKKYFFHATDARKTTEEYGGDDGETTDEDDESVAVSPPAPSTSQTMTSNDRSEAALAAPSVSLTGSNDAMSSWFSDHEEDDSEPIAIPEDSDTDPDSDNQDMTADGLDDWFDLTSETKTDVASADSEFEVVEDIARMGEDDNAKDYDPDKIFRHLCFYLDTRENAERNGLKVDKQMIDNSDLFTRLEDNITKNGGRIVDLDYPKLTHIVFDKRDVSRRLELMRRTSMPKRRNLVLSQFVDDCLEDETLLDEAYYAP